MSREGSLDLLQEVEESLDIMRQTQHIKPVKVKAILEDGTEVRIKADNYLARTLMHEIDHLNGILFIDHIKDDTDAFYKLDKEGNLKPLDYDKHIKGNKDLFPDD